jgi:hypothetical protein
VEAFDMIRDGVFGNVEYFKDLVDSVNDIPNSGNDWFLVRASALLSLGCCAAAVAPAGGPPALLLVVLEGTCKRC